MAIDLEKSMPDIEHDHTQLDVMFEDLHAIAVQGFGNQGDPALLEDAWAQWDYLQEDIARHFGSEERKIFARLTAKYPDLSEPFARLAQQHQMLRRELAQMGQMLKGTPAEVVARREQFEAKWQNFDAVWRDHSNIEWELLQSVVADRKASEVSG